MFNKLKQFKDLRDQAKTLQSLLAAEKIELEKDGIKIVINGNQEVLSLVLPQNITPAELQNKLPSIFNEAVKKAQFVAARKLQASGMSLPGF